MACVFVTAVEGCEPRILWDYKLIDRLWIWSDQSPSKQLHWVWSHEQQVQSLGDQSFDRLSSISRLTDLFESLFGLRFGEAFPSFLFL